MAEPASLVEAKADTGHMDLHDMLTSHTAAQEGLDVSANGYILQAEGDHRADSPYICGSIHASSSNGEDREEDIEVRDIVASDSFDVPDCSKGDDGCRAADFSHGESSESDGDIAGKDDDRGDRHPQHQGEEDAGSEESDYDFVDEY